MSESRLEQMRERCEEFHKENPEVWESFVRLTSSRIDRGFRHYSARAIFHQIRWENEKPDYEKGEEFKVNDHHSPFYARRFMKMYPEHDGFFRVRVQTSADDEASNLPELGPQDYK